MDEMTFKLLSEKIFVELIKTQCQSNPQSFEPGLIAHLACDSARAFLIKRDAMLQTEK